MLLLGVSPRFGVLAPTVAPGRPGKAVSLTYSYCAPVRMRPYSPLYRSCQKPIVNSCAFLTSKGHGVPDIGVLKVPSVPPVRFWLAHPLLTKFGLPQPPWTPLAVQALA